MRSRRKRDRIVIVFGVALVLIGRLLSEYKVSEITYSENGRTDDKHVIGKGT